MILPAQRHIRRAAVTALVCAQIACGDDGSDKPSTDANVAPATPASSGDAGVLGGSLDAAPSGPGAAVGQNEWRMMGYSAANTYWNPAETKISKETASRLEVAWTTDMGDNVYGAPLQIGDTIYASAGTNVQAFNAETGEPVWRNTRVGTTGSLAYDNGTLYANSFRTGVVALNAADGEIKWMKRPTDRQTDGSSSPILAGDLVLIGGSAGQEEISGPSNFRGYLAALKKDTGDVAWVGYTVPENVSGASIWSSAGADLANNRVYGTTGNNYGGTASDTSDAMLAFNSQTGDIEWKNQRTENDTWCISCPGPDHDFGTNPVLYDAMVGGVMTPLVSGGQKSGSAHAFRRDTGELVWTRTLGTGSRTGASGVFTSGAWTGKYILYACNEGGTRSDLYALDGGTGEVVWKTPLNGVVFGRVSVANGVGFVGAGPELVIFDVDTGAVIKTVPGKGGTLASTITIANGRVAYGEGMSWASSTPGSTLTVLSIK